MKQLQNWLHEKRGRTVLMAAHLGLSQPFVSAMASGIKAIPVAQAANIEQFTGGAVTRQQMFPNDWHRIWPELADDVGHVQPFPPTHPQPAHAAHQAACAQA